jgi:FkbM family methyltransferase
MLSLSDIATRNRFELEEICRSRAQPVYLGDHTALCRVLGRYKLYLSTLDHGFGSHVLLDGFWEMWLTIFIARIVKPGMVAADIGANFGYYTLLLADLVGERGQVHAIEPNPEIASLLRRTVALNGFAPRTTIAEAAAGVSDGSELTLFVPHGEPKNATVVAASTDMTDGGSLHRVKCRSMDALLADCDRVDFLKIDAEGAEQDIIAGMERVLDRFRPAVVLEFNARRYAEPAGFLARLTDIYGTVRHIDYSGDPVAVDPANVVSKASAEDWLLFFSQ